MRSRTLLQFGASGLAWRRIVEGKIVEELWKHLVNAAPDLLNLSALQGSPARQGIYRVPSAEAAAVGSGQGEGDGGVQQGQLQAGRALVNNTSSLTKQRKLTKNNFKLSDKVD
jgi:hypothetical protein